MDTSIYFDFEVYSAAFLDLGKAIGISVDVLVDRNSEEIYRRVLSGRDSMLIAETRIRVENMGKKTEN